MLLPILFCCKPCIETEQRLYQKRTAFLFEGTQLIAFQLQTDWHVFVIVLFSFIKMLTV